MQQEPWFKKLRRYRETRGWSLTDAAHELVAVGLYAPDQLESARQRLISWEQGKTANPRKEARKAIAKAFDLPERAFFDDDLMTRTPDVQRRDAAAWTDLISRLRTDNSPRALEESAIEIDRVCTDYASKDAATVLHDVHELGGALTSLRSSVGLAGLRELYEQLGWLSMLHACLLYDTGDERGAHQARKIGASLAAELGDSRLGAWSDEIAAWIALTKGDPSQAIRAAQVGIDKAPHADVAAQLFAQQAKAYARLNDPHKTEVALHNVRDILDSVAMPENVRNHFAIDPTKATFYAMDAYRVVGRDAYADAMADDVIRTSRTLDGSDISPMRLAEGLLTKATVAARHGAVEAATDLAAEALAIPRQSTPSLLMVAREVAREIERYDAAEGAEFARSLRELTPA